jgi:hypothetical protein
MSSIRISNNSVSAVVSGYGVAEIEGEAVIVYLDIAPQHPKVVGAIWASLVNGAREWLRLTDDDAEQTLTVRGINRRYHRLTIDAPRIAGRARPKHIRLVAPLACQIEHLAKPFVALTWTWTSHDGQAHTLSPAVSLAAMLERDTPLPIRIAWGEYLLDEARARGLATPLLRGGNAPEGWIVAPTAWEDLITAGITAGRIHLIED